MTQAFSFTRSAAWLAAAMGAVVLTGCVVAPVDDGTYYDDRTYYNTGTAGYYNGTYYPAIPYEVVPVAPYTGAIWVNGYWESNRGSHYWRPGRYERPGWQNNNRPSRPIWDRNDNRPNWNRPNDRPNNRPNWNDNDRPNNRPGNNNRPPSHQINPPNNNDGSMLRPTPDNNTRPPAMVRPPSSNQRIPPPISREERNRLHKDPDIRGGGA